jgi:hypothetical protein
VRAPLPPIKTCPYGCRYANDGWHAENCPGPQAVFFTVRPAFQSEPEYEFERQADDIERRREEAEDVRLTYRERGISE